MLWTEERLNELKLRHEQGESAGDIARAMHASRNAVLGKLFRLGLHSARPVAKRAKRRRRRAPFKPRMTLPVLPAIAATEIPLDKFEHPKPLIELTDAECHWPGRGSPAKEFCAEPVVPGRPYCARHTDAAYHRLPSKVRM